ncbi:MAG: hypothetical protein M1812_003819 [Candelaria pacifica]|nr:MAG: hypothetical protein M1812_003819 [Candelaria pacifica]
MARRPSTSSSNSNASLLVHSYNRTFIRAGIGGAGNYHLADQLMPPTSIPSSVPISRSTGPFSSGIGGAGNIHHASERAIISSDEELIRARVRHRKAPTAYHVGIGGAGNRYRSRQYPSSPRSSSSMESNSSSDYGTHMHPLSGADRLMLKFRRPFTSRKRSIELQDLSRGSNANRGGSNANRGRRPRNHRPSFFGKVFSSRWLS